MYAVTSMPLDRRTRATFRRAEFGFLGVMILTCKHTPRFCGHPVIAGCFGLRYCCVRGVRTSWLIVGILDSLQGPRGHLNATDGKNLCIGSPGEGQGNQEDKARNGYGGPGTE